jgi:hypothetical protein
MSRSPPYHAPIGNPSKRRSQCVRPPLTGCTIEACPRKPHDRKGEKDAASRHHGHIENGGVRRSRDLATSALPSPAAAVISPIPVLLGVSTTPPAYTVRVQIGAVMLLPANTALTPYLTAATVGFPRTYVVLGPLATDARGRTHLDLTIDPPTPTAVHPTMLAMRLVRAGLPPTDRTRWSTTT